MLALPDGGILVAYFSRNGKIKISLIDELGNETRSMECSFYVSGLMYSKPWIYIVQKDGLLRKIMEDMSLNRESTVKLTGMDLGAGELLKEDVLLIPDYKGGQVFEYDMKNNKRDTKKTGLYGPSHVACYTKTDKVLYIVTEREGCCVGLYNKGWIAIRKFGSEGSMDGELRSPTCTILLPNNHLLVCDRENNRISEFTIYGVFIKQIETYVEKTKTMSLMSSALWVGSNPSPFVTKLQKLQILYK